jgi:hypothetical protein
MLALQTPEIINLGRGKTHFGSWFWSFQFMVTWRSKTAHLMVVMEERQRERGVCGGGEGLETKHTL